MYPRKAASNADFGLCSVSTTDIWKRSCEQFSACLVLRSACGRIAYGKEKEVGGMRRVCGSNSQWCKPFAPRERYSSQSIQALHKYRSKEHCQDMQQVHRHYPRNSSRQKVLPHNCSPYVSWGWVVVASRPPISSAQVSGQRRPNRRSGRQVCDQHARWSCLSGVGTKSVFKVLPCSLTQNYGNLPSLTGQKNCPYLSI